GEDGILSILLELSRFLFPKNIHVFVSYPALEAPPCETCVDDLGGLIVAYADTHAWTELDKMVRLELVCNSINHGKTLTIGASHGWVASLKEDGTLCLQDDLNPYASYTDPKRIPLPPLVTLPHCQTKIITNVSMSSSSPEDDEDCVVAVKFLGPQLSFCKPAGKSRKPKWTSIKLENPCFYSSRVMFSKKHNMFRIPGSGGHLIRSWDPCNPSDDPKLQSVRKSEHLVESRPTGETFLVKQYKKLAENDEDDEGNAVQTRDMGDLVMFISMSEPFCVPSTSFPGMYTNNVYLYDYDENGYVDVAGTPFDMASAKDPPLFLFFSLTASQPPYGKPLLVLSSSLDLGVRRSSSVSLLISNGFSTSLRQSPPGFVIAARFCGHDQARLTVCYANQRAITDLDKRVPMNLVYPHIHNELMMIKRKRIPLPPLVTLPNQNHHQQDDEDCVVAVKFLGPQLSFCRPDESKPEWTSIKLENPCFHSSRVMFSKKDKVFRILGCEDHLIASCEGALCGRNYIHILDVDEIVGYDVGDISIATTS
ncbi:hypothetical protein HID58_005134, partial [Brassica napus]